MHPVIRSRTGAASRTLVSSLLALLLLYAMFYVPLPYYIFQPGLAEPIGGMVSLSGAAGTAGVGSEETGRLLMTTVGVSKSTVIQLAEAGLRGYAVRRISDVRQQGESEAAFDERQHRIMLTSQADALQAAYRQAGVAHRVVTEGNAQRVQPEDPAKQVTLKAEDVGGPSAGLLFALEIYSRLTPGDLTKGYIVAGTGTITPAGAVGAVGGARFKVAAAMEAGAEVFLVPPENAAEAEQAARQLRAALVVVPAASLGEAVAYLERLPPKGQAPL